MSRCSCSMCIRTLEEGIPVHQSNIYFFERPGSPSPCVRLGRKEGLPQDFAAKFALVDGSQLNPLSRKQRGQHQHASQQVRCNGRVQRKGCRRHMGLPDRAAVFNQGCFVMEAFTSVRPVRPFRTWTPGSMRARCFT